MPSIITFVDAAVMQVTRRSKKPARRARTRNGIVRADSEINSSDSSIVWGS